MRRVVKYGLFFVALLISLAHSGCALTEKWQASGRTSEERVRIHLARGQKMLGAHDYGDALQECTTALADSDGKPPGDEALLCLAQIWCDPENPKRELPKSVEYLDRFVNAYPQNPEARLARVWMENLEELESLAENQKELERLKKTSAESAQENEKLKRLLNEMTQENERSKRRAAEISQENGKLKRIVEQSTTVDVEMDEKKRNQAK